MVKWLWEQPWDFSALGGPARSVSGRVAKLAVLISYSRHCHSKERPWAHDPDAISWP